MDTTSVPEHLGDDRTSPLDPRVALRAPVPADDAMTSRFRSARVLLMLVVLAFVVSTVPGVRSQDGYDLLLDGVLNNVAYEAAAGLALLRVLALPRSRRTPSAFLLPLALGLYGLGNVYWTIFLRPLAEQPFPSVADALFLSFYPLVFVVLMLKLRLRAPASLWLDGLVIGLALGGLIAAVAIRPILEAGVGSWAAVVTTAAYPLLDLVLLLMLTITLSMYRWRPPFGVWLLTAGLLIFIIADVVYLFATASGTYTSGGPVDGVWVLGVFSMALTPGWASRPTGLVLPTWTLLAVPLVSTLLALGLLVFDHVHPLHLAAVALAAATIVVALGRLMVTFRQVSSLSGSHELARTDELTGLGNRRALYDATPALLKERDPAGLVALMLLDLDRFKEVNDSLGHHAGDAVLCQVAERLAGFRVHDAELVVRLGGDEFALVLTEAAASETERVAEAIRAAVSEPMVVDGVVMRVDTSIGIAVLPSGAADLPVLLRQADVAMYRAKTQRLGSFAYRAEADEFASGDRLQTIERLRESIAQRRMVLHYQPKVDRLTGRATSVEALVRWQDPERGLLPPAAFLPLVEHSGLMPELTASVLEQALDQAAVWHAEGRELSVAVNLTAASLDDAGLPARVAGMLTDRGLPGTALQIEITEDFLMGDHQRARAILSGLRQLGVRISVDDYGTGYSSLSYLRELPIDELKLDRSFLTHFVDDPRASAIVRSTIGLAHSLGLRLVAEGVEDATTSLELTEAGCDVQQGYYYAKPLPAEELGRWLDEDAPAAASSAHTAPGADPAPPASPAETSPEPA